MGGWKEYSALDFVREIWFPPRITLYCLAGFRSLERRHFHLVYSPAGQPGGFISPANSLCPGNTAVFPPRVPLPLATWPGARCLPVVLRRFDPSYCYRCRSLVSFLLASPPTLAISTIHTRDFRPTSLIGLPLPTAVGLPYNTDSLLSEGPVTVMME